MTLFAASAVAMRVCIILISVAMAVGMRLELWAALARHPAGEGATAMIDHLADTARWWTVLGAVLGLFYGIFWLREQIAAPQPLVRMSRIALTAAWLGAMAGWIIAGLIIPFATDGRVTWFTEEAFAFRGLMALAWCLWGACAWGTALVLARDRWTYIAGGCATWWAAMFIATEATVNAGL